MIKVYSDEDLNQVYKQRAKVLYAFFGVAAVYLVVCIACLCYYISLPYGDPNLDIPKFIVYSLTAIFVCFAFPFMNIKFRRVNRYYKMLYYLSKGIKNEEENYFVKFEERDVQRDNVDAISCVFMTWNKKKQEWMRREVYFDVEKPLPDFGRGDRVRYVAQSNFIIQYEILEKSVLEIEEINEYDEYGKYYEKETEEETQEVETFEENSQDCVEVFNEEKN